MPDAHAPRPKLAKPRFAVLGAPVQVGASQLGTVMGPAALRTAGLISNLQELGHHIEDRGDLSVSDFPRDNGKGRNARFFDEISAWSRSLSDHSYRLLQDGYLPIFLGGDHSLSMGSVHGVLRHCAKAKRDLFVLWLDAHADFNTPETSPSGNMHGMSTAFLCGEKGFNGFFESPFSPLPPQNLYIFGLRSVDRDERALLRERGVHVCDMRQVDEFGVSVLMRQIIDHVAARDGHLHVSLDVDFLDPSIAPGAGTPVPGGATYREAHLIMEMLHDSGLVGSLDIVELNPFLDERGKSAHLLVDLVGSLFGRQIVHRL
ncbi:arginase [Microvirga flavescens]|uniref:arginase n=1 Tax=Microvirga flavescens TaxID=2249811 RepID=UPI000DD87074|nr:arginase [Microvirga flavescens]